MTANEINKSRKEKLLEQGFLLTTKLPGRWSRRVRESAQWVLDYNGARGTGRRAIRFARFGRRSPLLVAPFGEGLMVVDPHDEEIGRVVYIRGEYERSYLASAVEYLRSRNGLVPEEATVVDVGANIGTTTVDALLHFGFKSSVSIEPDRRNMRLLRMNLLINDLQDRATVVNSAASDFDGSLRLQRHDSNFGDSRVFASATDGEAVDAFRIDTVLAQRDVDPRTVGLLWIDVQGHEAQVLRGASTLITAGVPVVLEYGMMDSDDLDELEALAAANYSHVVDVRKIAADPDRADAIIDSGDLHQLRGSFGLARQTDLLLVRK